MYAAHRSGASRICCTDRLSSASKFRAAIGLRSRYQLSAARYSGLASVWNSTGSFAIEDCLRLFADGVPRNGLYLSGLDVGDAASDLLLPGLFHVLIDCGIETVDESACQFGPFLFRQSQRLMKQFGGFLRHEAIVREESVGF